MRTIGFVVACSLSVTTLVTGQVPERLTLDDAIRIAELRSPIQHRTENELARAEIQTRRAMYNTYLPSLSSDLTFGASRERNYVGEDFDGNPLPDPYTFETTRSSSRQAIGMSFNLFSGSNLMQLRSQRAAAKGTDASVAMQRHALRADVTRRFFQALQAEDGLTLEERLMASAHDNLAALERMFRVARADLEDIHGARLEVLRSEIELEAARGEVRKARLALLESMGVEVESLFELVGDLPEPFDPVVLDEDAIVSSATRASPRVLQAEANVDVSAANVRAQRTARWPTVTAFAGYNRARTAAGTDAFFELNPTNWGYNAGIQVRWPIPLFRLDFNQSAAVAGAELTHADARENLRAARLSVENDTRALLIDLRNAFGRLNVAEESVRLWRERVRLQEERFAVGERISFVDLERIRESAAQAERQVLAARIAFQNVLLALEQLVGHEVRP